MRFLFCCEFYHPSVGGVQEVMRQIAERMVQRGHQVTVATTRLMNRASCEVNGVRIEEFDVTGNAVRGIEGDVDLYKEYVMHAEVDAILIKAAQQWTFDALWPVINQIKARKIFIPCGFSAFHEPTYARYFEEMPKILKSFDHMIFYAENYRDINFIRSHDMTNYSIVPNGASEIEFSVPGDKDFRKKLGIPEDAFVFLTVGTFSGSKGHLEVAEAFAKLNSGDRPAVLILNGNVHTQSQINSRTSEASVGNDSIRSRRLNKTIFFVKSYIDLFFKFVRYATGLVASSFKEIKKNGPAGILKRIGTFIGNRVDLFPSFLVPMIPKRIISPLDYWIEKGNLQSPIKRVLKTDLPRRDLIQAFKTTNLFVFASNIEYSPLVLYEAAAAGTPFLTVPVGNSEEIVKWTGGGIICPAPKDKLGYSRVNPDILASEMRKAMDSPVLLKELGRTGRRRWRESFTWDTIADSYEAILTGNLKSS